MTIGHLARTRTKRIRKPVKRRARRVESVELQTLKAHENEFRGKNVIVVGKEIYPIENGEQAERLLEELRRKYPKNTPMLTYVWDEETYILCLWPFGSKKLALNCSARSIALLRL
jgi:hypothetical protein